MSHSLAEAALGRVPTLSMGTVAMAVIGLALYQVTSLELGPRAHDFQVNLTVEPLVAQDLAQPLEKADALVGQISVVLRGSPPVALQPVGRRSAASAAGPAAPESQPATATSQPVVVTNPPPPLPIIGRCQNHWTGSLSATSPSNVSDRGIATQCSRAVGRD